MLAIEIALWAAAGVIADSLDSPLLGAALAIGAWAGGLLLALNWLRIALHVTRGQRPTVRALFDTRGYSTYFWASVLVLALVWIGVALFVIPGLILATLFCFYGFVIAERGDIGVFEAIDWSVEITRGNRWKVFGLILLLTLINLLGVALAGIGVLFTMGISVLAFASVYSTLGERSENDLSPDATVARNVGENRTLRFVLITVAVAAFGYWVPQWAWGWDMPAGELVWGFIIGSLTALMAFGLALIYKSNKVINFAQADLGAVPASLCVSLITLELWSFWIALPVALIASVALGSFVEFVIIRRFAKAPRLILMVVTVGLAQLLAGLGVAIPFFLGADLPQQTYNPPFDFSFQINPVIFHANDLIAVIATRALDHRALRVPPLHEHRHRAPGELGELRPRVPARRERRFHPQHRLGDRHAARDHLVDPAGGDHRVATRLRVRTRDPAARAHRGGDRTNGELHRDLPGFVRSRRGGDDRRLEQGLGRARRPDHVRDRDRRPAAPAAEQRVPRRGPGHLELAERRERASDPPRADAAAGSQVDAPWAARPLRRLPHHPAVHAQRERHQPRRRGRHLRDHRGLTRDPHRLGR